MRVSLISRYIIKTLLVFFLGALFVLASVFVMQRFIQLFTLAMSYGANMSFVFYALLKILPEILGLVSPMAFLIGLLLTMTSMGESGEIMALRAAGFSFGEIIRPLALFAVILSALLLYANNFSTPKNTKEFLDARTDIRGHIGNVVIEPKTFTELGDWNFYAEEVDRKNNLSQVQLLKKSDRNALSTKINAEKGKLKNTKEAIMLELYNGQLQRASVAEDGQVIVARFSSYNIYFPLVEKTTRELKPSEMTTPELHALSLTMQSKEKAETRTEISMRQVLALAPLILLFLSCPIGLTLGRSSNKTWAMFWSVVILLGFYLTLSGGLNIGKKYLLLSYWAPFAPVVIGAAAAVILWKKKLKR